MEVLLSVRSKSDGTEQQLRCPANGGLTLGRSPQSPLPLNGNGISRDHVRFEADGAALAVTDLSSNGTWVNGKRIPRGRPVALKESDSIEVPGYEIRLRIPSEQPAPVRAGAPSAPPPAKENAAVHWLHSFTLLERFVAAIAVLSLLLVLLYLGS